MTMTAYEPIHPVANFEGITQRDHLASLAMQAMARHLGATSSAGVRETLAKHAYQIADAMIDASGK